jgi:hypothetical protein
MNKPRVGEIWRKVVDSGDYDVPAQPGDLVEIIVVDGNYVRWGYLKNDDSNGWNIDSFMQYYQIDEAALAKEILKTYEV